jgi:hypothetical protein
MNDPGLKAWGREASENNTVDHDPVPFFFGSHPWFFY